MRGILAFIVVIHHFVLLFYPKLYYGSYYLTDYETDPHSMGLLIANTPLNIFMNGNWAVCMFLLLSGFVLSLRYNATNDITIIQDSFFKRYFRLTIPILGTVLLVYVLHRSGLFKSAHYPRTVTEFSFGKDLFTNNLSFLNVIKMALVDVPLYGNNTYVPVFWTMDIELVGVLLLFAFLMLTHQLKHKTILYVLFIAFLIYIQKTYYVLIFVGSLFALHQDLIERYSSKKIVFILIFLIGLFLSGIPNLADNGMKHTWYAFTIGWSKNMYMYVHFLSCALMFLALLVFVKIQRVFSSKSILFLGDISYAMYLIHLPILFIVGSNIMLSSKGATHPFMLFIYCLTAVIICSYLFYRAIDKYSIQWAGKISKKLFRRTI
ncbi:MAG: acyltransferase [Bacteroidia bacterium]|nr:acyltransferase [Bacteroidia bacterium]